jgi:hypothetical protein
MSLFFWQFSNKVHDFFQYQNGATLLYFKLWKLKKKTLAQFTHKFKQKNFFFGGGVFTLMSDWTERIDMQLGDAD